MVIVFLLAAIFFYIVLYLIYEYSKTQVHTIDGWLTIINNMIWMPDDIIFMMLRGLIIIVLFYVVIDTFIAGVKRTKRRKLEKIERDQALELKPKIYDKNDPSY
jgi:hypothetical protein